MSKKQDDVTEGGFGTNDCSPVGWSNRYTGTMTVVTSVLRFGSMTHSKSPFSGAAPSSRQSCHGRSDRRQGPNERSKIDSSGSVGVACRAAKLPRLTGCASSPSPNTPIRRLCGALCGANWSASIPGVPAVGEDCCEALRVRMGGATEDIRLCSFDVVGCGVFLVWENWGDWTPLANHRRCSKIRLNRRNFLTEKNNLISWTLEDKDCFCILLLGEVPCRGQRALVCKQVQ